MVIQRFIVNIRSKKGEPVRMAKAFQEVDETQICQCVWYVFLSGMLKFAKKKTLEFPHICFQQTNKMVQTKWTNAVNTKLTEM